jgi:hypothetical protein
MDITSLAAWGEFLGGIAVVVSLIYLASQIRNRSKSDVIPIARFVM